MTCYLCKVQNNPSWASGSSWIEATLSHLALNASTKAADRSALFLEGVAVAFVLFPTLEIFEPWMSTQSCLIEKLMHASNIQGAGQVHPRIAFIDLHLVIARLGVLLAFLTWLYTLSN